MGACVSVSSPDMSQLCQVCMKPATYWSSTFSPRTGASLGSVSYCFYHHMEAKRRENQAQDFIWSNRWRSRS